MNEEQFLQNLDSEYDNIEGLAAAMTDEEFLGAIRRNPKRFKNAMVRRSKTRNVGNIPAAVSEKTSSRSEMEKRFGMLSKNLQQGLMNKSLQLTDAAYYVIKSSSGKTLVRLLEDDDTKSVGVSNISRARLEKNEVFLLSAIQVLYGVGVNELETPAGVAAITTGWGELPFTLQNGEFTLRANSKTLVDRASNDLFVSHAKVDKLVTESSANVAGYGYAYGQGHIGMFKLANPKLIETQQPIEFNIEFGVACPSNSYLKFVMLGTKVMKY